jgi:Fe-S cluster biogenesis protein NfuA
MMVDNTSDVPAEGGDTQGDFDAKVRAVIEKVRGYLQSHGGDIEIVAIENHDLKVRLKGACAGCPGATYTLKLGVEAALREEIPEFGNLIAVE